MLEGYAVLMVGGTSFIGRVASEEGGGSYYHVEPAYEAHIQYQMDDTGNFGIIRDCLPILGSTQVKCVDVPTKGCVVIRCESMSGKEREFWSRAIQKAEAMIKAMRAAESGIVLATNVPTPAALGAK